MVIFTEGGNHALPEEPMCCGSPPDWKTTWVETSRNG